MKGPGRERALLVAACIGILIPLLWIARRRALWYDELFSWYVSQCESPLAVLRALLDGADNGPPLDYLLRHTSMLLFGQTALAFRLPSALALLVACLCIYALLRQSRGPWIAAAAALLPLGTPALYYGAEGRAYAPLLAVLGLTLLAWQRSLRSRAWSWVLAISLLLAPGVHYYGIMNFVPPICAELRRNFALKGLEVRRWALLLLPALGVLLWLPFARNAMEMRAAFWASDFGLWSSFAAYPTLFGSWLWPVLSLVVAAALVRSVDDGTPEPGMGTLAVSAAAFPFLLLALAATLTRAMVDRYAVGSLLGMALLLGLALHRLVRRWRPLSWMVPMLALLLAGRQGLDAARAATAPALSEDFRAFLHRAELPIVFDSPMRYLESMQRIGAPEAERLHYLVDRELSRAELGFDNDEIALGNLRKIVPLNALPREEFLATHGEFLLLVDRRSYWLAAWLRREGWELAEQNSGLAMTVYRVRAQEP